MKRSPTYQCACDFFFPQFMSINYPEQESGAEWQSLGEGLVELRFHRELAVCQHLIKIHDGSGESPVGPLNLAYSYSKVKLLFG